MISFCRGWSRGGSATQNGIFHFLTDVCLFLPVEKDTRGKLLAHELPEHCRRGGCGYLSALTSIEVPAFAEPLLHLPEEWQMHCKHLQVLNTPCVPIEASSNRHFVDALSIICAPASSTPRAGLPAGVKFLHSKAQRAVIGSCLAGRQARNTGHESVKSTKDRSHTHDGRTGAGGSMIHSRDSHVDLRSNRHV